MAQFGDNGFGFYYGQNYQNFNNNSMPDFSAAQQNYGPHRASDPLGSIQTSQLARAGRELSLQRLTKPEDNQPWSSQFRNGYQQPQFSTPLWQSNAHGRGAMTEPAPNQELCIKRISSQQGSDVSDSAYASMPTSSGPQDNYNSNREELERNFYFANFKSEGSEAQLPINAPNPPRSVKSEGHHLIPHHRNNRTRQQVQPCPYPNCKKKPKNLSDAKKHELTHTKPHRCTEPDCDRKDGFATDNDLQRHRKSVHHLHPTLGTPAGFICVACPTPYSGQPRKFWPRRDNFKAHIKRKHSECNESQLIEMSRQINRPDDTQTVDEDNKSMRSAMHSSRRSQVDHNEAHGYSMSPNMSRHVQDQGDFNNSIFPDSNIDMQQDNFAGMGGHATDNNMPFSQYTMASTDSTNMDLLSAGHADYGMSTSPFKKPKLNHEYSYGRANAPPFQGIISEPSTTSSTSNTQSSTTSSFASQGEWKCKDCGKLKRRECDLKKHRKRHTRPYGCTFPGCHKKFGSRNDWKRHESSQHFLHEMWKCSCPKHDGTRCTRRPFRDLEALKRHLRSDDHGLAHLSESEMLDECRKYLLGREGHERFWCGFCQKLVSQEKALQNAWDARFKHIGDHFDKEGRDSLDWVCIEENKAKRYITMEGAVKGKGAKGKEEKDGGEEEGELPGYDPGVGVGVASGENGGNAGFVEVEEYQGQYGFGYLGSHEGGGKRKRSAVDSDAEGESDHDMY